MTSLTRRDLARMLAPLLAPLAARNASGPLAARTKIEVSLVQEFARSTVKAFSPDGKKLCVEDWAQHGYPLRVLEVDTWRPIYTARFQSRIQSAGFFGDSQSLLVQALGSTAHGACGAGKGNCELQKVAVDLRTGGRIERLLPFDFDRGDTYTALSTGILLDAHYEMRPYRTETLALVEFPSLREVARAQYATLPRESMRHKANIELSNDFGFGISDDRRLLAYSFDHTLVCRRAEDLQMLWSRQIEPQLNAYKVVVSARGTRVAAAVSDGGFTPSEQRISYVAVYNGETGSDIARLPQSGTEGIALSPDGDLIAIVARVTGMRGEVEPTVRIYETASGLEVGSVVHDTVKKGRRQPLEASCTAAFTSDGQYLVTSGMTTKVWKMAQ